MMQVNNNLWHDNCPVCNSPTISKVGVIRYSSPLYYSSQKIGIVLSPELWRCQTCKSRFVQNAIREDESATLYQQGEAGKRWSFESRFEISKTEVVVSTIESFSSPGSFILDIGCNTGEILDFAKDKGCKTFGVEYSESSLSILRNKGHRVYSRIEEVKEEFDLVIACDLIEHLYDVPKFLDICFRILKTNAHLIVLTGNIDSAWSKLLGSDWWYVQYPEHIVFPSKNYFNSHQGFHVVDWIPTYASPHYQQPLIPTLKNIARSVFKGTYSGLPSMIADHSLIVLKRGSEL